MHKSKPAPVEDDSVVAARNRQTIESTKLDEEENRRVKQMRVVARGVRSFRGIRSRATAARGAADSSTPSAPMVDPWNSFSGYY